MVVEMLGTRRGVMKNMVNTTTGTVRLEFLVPTRGLLGFRSNFLSATRGDGVIHTLFHGYLPHAGEIGESTFGSLVAFETGTTTTFGLKNAEDRGTLFYGAGVIRLCRYGGWAAPASRGPGYQCLQEKRTHQYAGSQRR